MTDITISLKDNNAIKPCPICGSREEMYVMSPKFFNEVKKRYGSSKIDIGCRKCRLEMSVYTYEMGDPCMYSTYKKVLYKRWNERKVPDDA